MTMTMMMQQSLSPTSIHSFLHLATSTVLHRCSSTLYMTKKKKNKNVCIFESALLFKLAKRVYESSHFYLETLTNLWPEFSSLSFIFSLVINVGSYSTITEFVIKSMFIFLIASLPFS
jgi:hypothetical protein